MKNTQEQFYAVVAPGFEQVCAAELRHQLQVPVEIDHGGISFSGKLKELYQANLWSRCASRIVVRLDHFICRDFPALYRKSVRLPWGRFIKPGTRLDIRVTSHKSRLNHSGRIAETLAEAIHKALGTAPTQPSGFCQQILIRINEDLCQISIDSSGERLHRRGYRQKMTPAPLRETLAAGCLLHCGWQGQYDFFDGLCGSGTLAIEAALIAANKAPGRHRAFAFQQWPGYRPQLWQTLADAADTLQRIPTITITAGDQDQQAIDAARANSVAAGVHDMISFQTQPFASSSASSRHGLWLSNPPYGERLQHEGSAKQLFTALQRHQRTVFPDWEALMILPEAFDRQRPASLRFLNGGLAVALYPLSPLRT